MSELVNGFVATAELQHVRDGVVIDSTTEEEEAEE